MSRSSKVPTIGSLVIGKGKYPAGEVMRADAATVQRRQRGGRAGELVYSRALTDEICWRLASGQSLRQICKEAHMPSETAVRFWAIEDRDGFASRYTQAREALMDRWADDLIEIADDVTLEPNDRRVRTDNRRWLMSKLAYRKYGDKLVHSGDPENPVLLLHKKAEVAVLDPEQLALIERWTLTRLISPNTT